MFGGVGGSPYLCWGLEDMGACFWAGAERKKHPHGDPLPPTAGSNWRALNTALIPLFGGGRCVWRAWLVSCPLIPADRGVQVGKDGHSEQARPIPSGPSSSSDAWILEGLLSSSGRCTPVGGGHSQDIGAPWAAGRTPW